MDLDERTHHLLEGSIINSRHLQKVVSCGSCQSDKQHAGVHKTARVRLMFVVQSKKLSNLDPEKTIVAGCANVAKWNYACDVSEYKTVVLILLTKLLPVWQEPATIEIKVQTSFRNSNEKA